MQMLAFGTLPFFFLLSAIVGFAVSIDVNKEFKEKLLKVDNICNIQKWVSPASPLGKSVFFVKSCGDEKGQKENVYFARDGANGDIVYAFNKKDGSVSVKLCHESEERYYLCQHHQDSLVKGFNVLYDDIHNVLKRAPKEGMTAEEKKETFAYSHRNMEDHNKLLFKKVNTARNADSFGTNDAAGDSEIEPVKPRRLRVLKQKRSRGNRARRGYVFQP